MRLILIDFHENSMNFMKIDRKHVNFEGTRQVASNVHVNRIRYGPPQFRGRSDPLIREQDAQPLPRIVDMHAEVPRCLQQFSMVFSIFIRGKFHGK